jgi:hypothetical protein
METAGIMKRPVRHDKIIPVVCDRQPAQKFYNLERNIPLRPKHSRLAVLREMGGVDFAGDRVIMVAGDTSLDELARELDAFHGVRPLTDDISEAHIRLNPLAAAIQQNRLEGF